MGQVGEASERVEAYRFAPVVLFCDYKDLMKCILWNCREANKPQFHRSIRYLLKKFRIDILAVFETHPGGEAVSRICRGLGFGSSFRVDACGQSGGLWLLWGGGRVRGS